MEGVLPSDTVTVEGTVEDFTVNMINSRKLSLQALILLSARIEEIYDEELPVGIQGEDTEAGVEYRIAPMEVTQLAICKMIFSAKRRNSAAFQLSQHLSDPLEQYFTAGRRIQTTGGKTGNPGRYSDFRALRSRGGGQGDPFL